MAVEFNDLLKLLPGSKVVIVACEGVEHSESSSGCLCSMKGTIRTVGQRYRTPFTGTPTWHIEGSDKRFRLDEVTLVVEERS